MDEKGLEQRVTVLEKEILKLKELVNFDRIDCGYWYDKEG
jgi:hypothetical protein